MSTGAIFTRVFHFPEIRIRDESWAERWEVEWCKSELVLHKPEWQFSVYIMNSLKGAEEIESDSCDPIAAAAEAA